VGWECPEKGIYLDKWSKERGEGGEGIKIKLVGIYCLI
jgi:hypothetical protein